MKTIPFGDFGPEFRDEKNAKIVIVPVPYDGTSTWMKGADKGPAAILEASYNLENYDIETKTEVYKKGIYTDAPINDKKSPEQMVASTEARVLKWINSNKFVVTIGGEHSVTTGAIKAHAQKYPGLSVLQLDAHTDLRDSYLGSKYNHACVMARVMEICPFVQVGIRSLDVEELSKIKQENIFYARNIHNTTTWMDNAEKKLNTDVYITIDLDVFDPSIMPSTGTPEPGGLLWYPVTEFLKKVCINHNVIGFDIVELCPDKKNKAPDFLAAKLIYKLLSYVFAF